MTYLHYLMISFLFNGIFTTGIKAVTELGLDRSTPLILTVMYVTALSAALVHVFLGKAKINKQSLLVGLAAGLSSVGTMCFYMLAMTRLPGYIVFSINSGGTIILTALVGKYLLGEKIGPFGIAGFAAGIVAIVLLAG